MCFDADASPPIGSNGVPVQTRDLVLEADDGIRFAAYESTAGESARAGVVVLPDVRGLFRFYRELAVRFAENGLDAVAIDYFGRTAGLDPRSDDFPFMDHVAQTTLEGITFDASAAVAHLRSEDPRRPVFTVGFCFGGSNSWHLAASGLDLAGAIGFYGNPRGTRPAGAPPVIDRVEDIDCPILCLMAGDDPGIPPEVVTEFEHALEAAGVKHEVMSYPDAPHSFFDRRQEDFSGESEDAWRRVLEFIAANARP